MSGPIPSFDKLVPTSEDFKLIYELESEVFKKAYELIKKIVEYETSSGRNLQIATCESLTAGLIMSTLVHVPYGGYVKYGCFGVYDTDAKRVFSGVKVSDVYTHTCAREMAVGLLKNSNATITISVSGNAMPSSDQLSRLGELFIGIAGYVQKEGKRNATQEGSDDTDVEIIYQTRSSSECLERHDNLGNRIKKNCKLWIESHAGSAYPPRAMTASISRLIRNYTALSAMQFAIDFLQSNVNLIVPYFVVEAKQRNEETLGENPQKHGKIPPSKYPSRNNIADKCTNNISQVNDTYKVCDEHNTENQYGKRWNIKDYYEERLVDDQRRADQEEADLAVQHQMYAQERQAEGTEGGKKFREKKRNTRRKKRRSKKNIPKRNNKKLSHKKVHI